MKKHLLSIVILAQAVWAQLPSGVEPVSPDWIPFELSSFAEMKGTPLDMAWLLEAPAGKHGFLAVKDDGFAFADGTPARFWGGNIFGEANFPDKEEAVRLADIIARSGANIVRMHHLDVVKPWTDKIVKRSLFGGQMPESTRTIDPAMLDKFQFMFHCLKERGIYIFLSHTSSRFVMAGDGFPGDREGLADADQGFKVEGLFDPYLIQLQQEYLKALLTAKNPYTGLAMIDDPALVLTEIINENSLFWLQPDGWFGINSPYYRTMLQGRFGKWLQEKYASQETLVEKWSQPGKKALLEKESLAEGTIAIPACYVKESDWPVSDLRKRDTYLFLYELQRDYYEQMHAFLRKTGLKIPIAGSNHWATLAAELHVNARLDYVDRHDYWTHPEHEYNYIAGQGIQAKPMVKEAEGGILGSLARRRVFGKPYTVSEWHAPLPNPYRAEGTPLMAAFACLHGWHPMHYAYWGDRQAEPAVINSFEALFDPAQMNLIPIAALMFHRQDFQEDRQGYFETLTPEQTMNPKQDAGSHPEAALVGKYGLAFTDLTGAPNPNQTKKPDNMAGTQGVFRSVTGEIDWDARQGVAVLNSPRSQGVVGFIGGQKLATEAMTFQMTTGFGVVMAASLTGKPLADSQKILIATSGDARFSGIEMSDNFGIIKKSGHFPFLMQPIEGTVTLTTSHPIQVTALSPGGQPLGTVKTEKGVGGYSFQMTAGSRAMHYLVTKQGAN